MTCRLSHAALLAWLAGAGTVAADAAQPGWAEVAPIFAKRCINCHSDLNAAKALRLDTYDSAMAGSEDGPVLLPGDATRSELARRLRGDSTPRMPFLSVPLPPEELDLILRWIEAGLPEESGQR